MAPVVTAVPPPTIPPPKPKKPVPPSLQTNGTGSSSPSPSLSTKKPPTVIKPPVIPTSSSGTNNAVSRPGKGPRREPSGSIAGRASRNSAGLRSASVAADVSLPPAVEPRPYGTCNAVVNANLVAPVLTNKNSRDREVHTQKVCRPAPVVDNPHASNPFSLRPAGWHVSL